MARQLVISGGTCTIYLLMDEVVYFEADHNYSYVVFRDKRRMQLSFQLGQIEKMIENQLGKDHKLFPRVGRGLIVNARYVHIVDVPDQTLILSDCVDPDFYYILQPSQQALEELIVAKNKLIFNGML